MAEVKVLPVPEGSIVWLHNVANTGDAPDDGYDMMPDLVQSLHEATGHKQFVVLVTHDDGIVEVLGPDELVERVLAALDA